MPERRPFPPSPRRRALARQAGLHAASPIVVGAVACGAAIAAAVGLGHAAATMIGAWIAAACDGRGTLDAATMTPAILALAGPLVGAAAIAAAVAHVAQTRSLWSPRRAIEGAPVIERGAARVIVELLAAAAIGTVAFGWLWAMAPRLAGLVGLGGAPLLAAAGSLIASLVVAVAIAWAVLGAVDALARHAELARALAMSPAEKREDDRLAAADPRWRARRDDLLRQPDVAGAALVVLGDDVAIAIAWDPVRWPVPSRLATGRGARATQILGLARRHRVPVHRDGGLAGGLVDGEGPIPDRYWPRLAEIVAAVRGRRASS